MKRLYTLLAILLFPFIAYAAEINFTASWDVPTTLESGEAATEPPSGYNLYVCDQPISQNTDRSVGAPSGLCDGNMTVYDAPDTPYSGTHTTDQENGSLYFRVTALREVVSGDTTMELESKLSNEVRIDYPAIDHPDYVRFAPPSGLGIEGNGIIVIIIR